MSGEAQPNQRSDDVADVASPSKTFLSGLSRACSGFGYANVIDDDDSWLFVRKREEAKRDEEG